MVLSHCCGPSAGTGAPGGTPCVSAKAMGLAPFCPWGTSLTLAEADQHKGGPIAVQGREWAEEDVLGGSWARGGLAVGWRAGVPGLGQVFSLALHLLPRHECALGMGRLQSLQHNSGCGSGLPALPPQHCIGLYPEFVAQRLKQNFTLHLRLISREGRATQS